MSEVKKKRGRPPGSGKKNVNVEEKLKAGISETLRKRGRAPKIEYNVVVEVPLEGEIEGTVSEKLKSFANQIKYMDHLLSNEPYRMDLRMKKTETISRMCFLINEL